jgi:hypothetical protein
MPEIPSPIATSAMPDRRTRVYEYAAKPGRPPCLRVEEPGGSSLRTSQ